MVKINEIRIDQSGTDNDEYFELIGNASESLDGLTYLVIGDGSGGSGTIEAVVSLTGSALDANGLFVAAEGTFSLGTADLTTTLNFENGDNVTHLLVEGFTGANGDDLDTNDDGTLDTTPWTSIVDSVALVETVGSGEQVYSGTRVGPNGSFVPAHVYRNPDESGDFAIGEFDPASNAAADTPGTRNDGLSLTAIYEIQGAAHISPFVTVDFDNLPEDTLSISGATVATTGIVTAVDSNGFYLQDATGDGNDATSDALFVFTGSSPTVSVGDDVVVEGTVSEFFPGDTDTRNLPSTQISSITSVSITSSGNALPTAIEIGGSGRIPPNQIIDDDAFGSFEPTTDGIDFFESLEGMLVTAKNLTAVSGTNRFGEIFAVVDNGANASGLSNRGTLNISPDDFNPEKIQIDGDPGILDFNMPVVNTGAMLGDVTGVMGYGFGNFEIIPTVDFSGNVTDSTLTPDVTTLQGTEEQITIASYNVLNLETNDSDGDMDVANGRFTAIAQQIVNNLLGPDIIGLQEIQDNSGSSNDGTVAADQTLQALVDEISAAGGPTYDFIDNTFITNNASGGQPGGNIRTAFLYNSDRVSLEANSIQTISSQALGEAFEGGRLPLVATFNFNGESVTVVNNHFSSKGGSAPILGIEQDFAARQEDVTVNGSLDERQAQSNAVKAFVEPLVTNGDNVVVLGDLNEFEFVSPVSDLETAGLTNLTNLLPEDERYTFIFQGNSQSLDHILVDNALATIAEFDIVNVNSEFAETEDRASDHDPLITRFALGEPQTNFTLQILHASDLEGGVDAIENAPNFAAVVDALEQDTANFDGSVLISAGDNFIPGPFFNAAGDRDLRTALQEAYQTLFNEPGLTNIREGAGRVDISIMNILGFDASAVGNHDFDAGTNAFAGLLETDIRGTTLADVRWLGAQFPYLSANLDFSADSNFDGLFTSDILPNTDFASLPSDLAAAAAAPKVAPATVIEVDGEFIGVVGATTQIVESISSTGSVTDLSGGANDMAALAAVLQPVINDVIDGDDDQLGTADDINKIILTSHLQQIALEKELAGLLSGVDVILAGGSDTLQADSTDILRSGDIADEGYPFLTTNLDGDAVAVVSTDGEYSYVGRLVVEFDEEGKLVTESIDENVSGAYATDEAGVLAVTGESDLETAIANSTKATEVKKLTDAVEGIVTAADSNILGRTGVFLEGRRSEVRTEATNLGNLTADANLAAAKAFDSTVVVSLKNAGGIRSQIGQVDGTTGELLITQDNPNASKEAGDISQLDVENALRFNNGLTLMTITLGELEQILEYGVSATAEGATPGQFPQVGGLRFSFDPSKTAIELADDGNGGVDVVTDGERIQNLALVDDLGNVTKVIVEDGVFVADPTESIRIVTLDFLAGIFSSPGDPFGGDGYPFPGFGENVVQLRDALSDAGNATFAAPGSEQDALAEFLLANHQTTPYFTQDTPASQDIRIQNLAETNGVDTVLSDVPTQELGFNVISTETLAGAEISAFDSGSDRLFVTADEGLQILDFSDPTDPSLITTLTPSANGATSDSVTSVAVGSGATAGIVAIAVPDAIVTNNGSVFFYEAATGNFLGSVAVGPLPDMLTFSPDGTKLLVANEGQSAGDENEPDTLPNPDGSVSIISLDTANLSGSAVQTLSFASLNGSEEALTDKGVRINPNAPSVGADLEPEYIAIEGNTAYITLQENNAIAVINDINNPSDFTVDDILPLGLKDFTLPSNRLDPSNEDDGFNLQNLPVFGMYMPDAIDTYTFNGQTYFVTANEGDGRDVDETRIADLDGENGPNLDPETFPDADALRDEAVLGRLKASNVDGDLDEDGDIDQIHVFGGRSFSIFDAEGNIVFDSGDLFARVTAEAGTYPDNRSDDKGTEPEGIIIAPLGEKTFAFVGLERSGGIMAFNITDPTDVQFVDYLPSEAGDISPEGLTFISASDSPTGTDLLVVTNEVSNTVTTYELGANPGFDPAEPGEEGIVKILDDGEGIRVKISVTPNSVQTNTLNEIVVFQVDDAEGTVNGVGKDDAGYLDAILGNSEGLFGALSLLQTEDNPSGLPGGLDVDGFMKFLPLLPDDTRIGFMLIEDGTLDELQAGTDKNVFFSTVDGFEISNFSSQGFDLGFEGNGNTFELEVDALDDADSNFESIPEGIGLQSDIEVLDLRDTGDLLGKVTVFSEAAYDNLIGFYRVDENGSILSATGDILSSVGDANYIETMLEESQTLGIAIDRNTSSTFTFEGGSILAPFIIANGDFNDFNLNEIYTPYLGVNADGADHFRMLGDNAFGVEDLFGGGDQDFDDMIVQIDFTGNVDVV